MKADAFKKLEHIANEMASGVLALCTISSLSPASLDGTSPPS